MKSQKLEFFFQSDIQSKSENKVRSGHESSVLKYNDWKV